MENHIQEIRVGLKWVASLLRFHKLEFNHAVLPNCTGRQMNAQEYEENTDFCELAVSVSDHPSE